MSCACEHKKLGSEYQRIRKLAKALAVMQNDTVALYKNEDGTYGFSVISETVTKPILEFISPY